MGALSERGSIANFHGPDTHVALLILATLLSFSPFFFYALESGPRAYNLARQVRGHSPPPGNLHTLIRLDASTSSREKRSKRGKEGFNRLTRPVVALFIEKTNGLFAFSLRRFVPSAILFRGKMIQVGKLERWCRLLLLTRAKSSIDGSAQLCFKR